MVIGDDAFPLKEYLQKPFHRRGLVNREIIFNYRLSRARRVVENAFGILSNRFRVFRAPIALSVPKARKLVLAATVLHNYLRTRKMLQHDPVETVDVEDTATGEVTPGGWQARHTEYGLVPLAVRGGRLARDAKVLRENLSEYFMTSGAVPWQWRIINK